MGNLKSLDRTGRAVLDQEKAIPFVCDFIVKYIASDVLVSGGHFTGQNILVTRM